MLTFFKKTFALLFGLAVLGGVLYASYWLLKSAARFIKSLDASVSGDVITMSGAIMVAAISVVLGQYLKSSYEIRADLRERKIEVYDEFLRELFNRLTSNSDKDDDGEEVDEELVKFLQNWQRKMVLRGGDKVLLSYIDWKQKLSGADADSVFSTDDLIKSIRKDIGHSNKGLGLGFFTHFWLRHSTLFLAAAKNNPKITLAELAELEAQLESNDT